MLSLPELAARDCVVEESKLVVCGACEELTIMGGFSNSSRLANDANDASTTDAAATGGDDDDDDAGDDVWWWWWSLCVSQPVWWGSVWYRYASAETALLAAAAAAVFYVSSSFARKRGRFKRSTPRRECTAVLPSVTSRAILSRRDEPKPKEKVLKISTPRSEKRTKTIKEKRYEYTL